MKCTFCKQSGFMDNPELARHILGGGLTHARGIKWATKVLNQLQVSDRIVKRAITPITTKGESICSLCHKPIGKQDIYHCCC